MLNEALTSGYQRVGKVGTHNIHPMKLREPARVAKVTRPGVTAVVAKIARNVPAIVAIAAHQISRLVFQRHELGAGKPLSVVKLAIGAVLAAVAQVIAVAKV